MCRSQKSRARSRCHLRRQSSSSIHSQSCSTTFSLRGGPMANPRTREELDQLALAAFREVTEAKMRAAAAAKAAGISFLPDDIEEDDPTVLVDVWKTIIADQQHFNLLGMQVRNFALTLLVAVLGGTALAVKEAIVVPLGQSGNISLATVVLLSGAGAWAGFYVLDRWWYHRLLSGAVEQGEAL